MRAAIAIADAENLAAVSIRRVGSTLGAGPMRLYTHLAIKEELFELMAEEIFKEIMADEPTGETWRKRLRAIAHATRKAATRHRWAIEILGNRPHLGPNGLAYLEHLLTALDSAAGFADVNAVMQAGRTFNAYVIGALHNEAVERQAEAASGLDETTLRTVSEPYIRRMIETGRYPMLDKVVRDAVHPSSDQIFEQGLNCVLDGIEAFFLVRQKS